uniref:Glycine N-acyltransferase-like protein n=1 Tax=Podarcis muralis TaxID=64176 RepID=A0A670IZM0_PODMU
MLILSCASKLQLLETLLKRNLPQTVAVYGAVVNINRGNPVGHEVIVDSWPDCKAVLTRPRTEADTDNTDLYKNIYAAFYWDLDVYRRLLLDTDAVNWKQNFRLYGKRQFFLRENPYVQKQTGFLLATYSGCWPVLTCVGLDDLSQKGGSWVLPTSLSILFLPVISSRLDPSFTISTLQSSHVDILNETWPHGGNEQSRRFLDNMVKCFPSICILDSNGHPISWSIMDPLGAQIHGYTLPSHRRRGYLAIVMRALSMQIHAAGCPVYGHTALNNVQTQNLLDYMVLPKVTGWQWWPIFFGTMGIFANLIKCH